uniref:SSD domain-containing protein n=1 Tax=Lotharella globosa TaxID=91324 RepID=A0A7S4DUM7_9EUKA
MESVQTEQKHEGCSCKKSCSLATSRFITHHPAKFMSATLAVILLVVVAGAFSGSYTLSEPSQYDWAVPNGRASLNYEALVDAEDDAARGNALTREQEADGATFWMTFEGSGSESIFTPANVQTICEIESLFWNTEGYSDYCQLNGTSSTCLDPTKTITYTFYGGTSGVSCDLLSDSSVNATAGALYSGLSVNTSRQSSQFFMGSETETRSPRYTERTRARIPLGAPLSGFVSPSDRPLDQSIEYNKFYRRVRDKFFNFFGLENRWLHSAYREKVERNGLRIKWYSSNLSSIESQDTILGDLVLALISILFVWGWMTYQMRSIFLSSFCMLSIVLSIPLSIVIYRDIFRVAYFAFLHILVIFLVLGIGADDVFVFYDGWRQAVDDEEVMQLMRDKPGQAAILEKRMEVAYKRTLETVFNTSFTTMVAFLATAISPIMPIATFGILAATCILINFVLVITLIPAVMMCHHLWFVKKRCSIHPSPGTEATPRNLVEAKTTEHDVPDATEDDDTDEANETLLDKFATKVYIPAMTYEYRGVYVVAIGIAISLLIYGVVSVAYAAQLTSPTEQETWLPSDNMLEQVPVDLRTDFMSGDTDQNIEVGMPFGISGFERPNFDPYVPAKNRGHVTYDSGFDLYPAASQNAFLYACELARSYPCNEEACQDGVLVHQADSSLQCFLPKFQSWFIANNPGYTTYNCSRAQFLNQLMVYRNATTSDGYSVAQKQKLIGFVAGELKYARITLTTTILQQESTAYKAEGRKVLDDMVNQINGNSPSGMNNAFGASFAWVWIESEAGVLRGFFTGLMLCFPVAFIVLVLATSNIIVSFYAIISIGFIVASVLGVTKWIGWALGIGEAIAGVIVIGFSVDYVIHLGHMFVEATHSEGLKATIDRFTFASRKMVPTVAAGGVTTFGAALPLFACQLKFFPKMGTLMASTIAFSFVFSVGFFMALCLLIGPVGRVGDISWMCEQIGLAPYLERWGCLTRNPRAPDELRQSVNVIPKAADNKVEMDELKAGGTVADVEADPLPSTKPDQIPRDTV